MRKNDLMLQLSRVAIVAAMGVLFLAATVGWTDALAPDLPHPAATSAGRPTWQQLPKHQPVTAPDSSALVRANPFATGREPPAARFQLAPMLPDTIAVADSETDTDRRPAFEVRLYGVSIGPAGTSALMDANPAIAGAEIYRVGDSFGGNRVIEISEQGVLVVGPNGRVFYPIPWNEQRNP